MSPACAQRHASFGPQSSSSACCGTIFQHRTSSFILERGQRNVRSSGFWDLKALYRNTSLLNDRPDRSWWRSLCVFVRMIRCRNAKPREKQAFRSFLLQVLRGVRIVGRTSCSAISLRAGSCQHFAISQRWDGETHTKRQGFNQIIMNACQPFVLPRRKTGQEIMAPLHWFYRIPSNRYVLTPQIVERLKSIERSFNANEFAS